MIMQELGVTALWVSPVFRQVSFEPSYHGYGIQNFFDVDPHFGTREELRDFVRAAHDHGMFIVLDIIAHHTGNVFAYDTDRYLVHDAKSGQSYYDPRWDGNRYGVRGFNDRNGEPTILWTSTIEPGSKVRGLMAPSGLVIWTTWGSIAGIGARL